MTEFSHFDDQGNAQMVDISNKASSTREAIAHAEIVMLPNTLQMIRSGEHKKGDVLGVARIAGIQAAKKCSDLIPLCHPLALTKVTVDFELSPAENKVLVKSFCKVDGKTGVEMEALTAASVAALTVYDMCKAVDKGMVIESVALQLKTGGKSGTWERS